MKFAVTIDMFVYAESNAEAIAKAHEIASELSYTHDNQANVIEIVRPSKNPAEDAVPIYPVIQQRKKT